MVAIKNTFFSRCLFVLYNLIHMPPFMAVDRTFSKAEIDVNGENFLLAWAVAESENTES